MGLIARVQRADKLLERIAAETLREKGLSRNERRFFREIELIKTGNYKLYVQYIQRYNEVHNSKYAD